jgi:hypothetical protein
MRYLWNFQEIYGKIFWRILGRVGLVNKLIGIMEIIIIIIMAIIINK